MMGQNFPVSVYLKEQILDAVTIARSGGWWTAVLVIKDPITQNPFLALYRWQFVDEKWRIRKSITFKGKHQIEKVHDAISALKEHFA